MINFNNLCNKDILMCYMERDSIDECNVITYILKDSITKWFKEQKIQPLYENFTEKHSTDALKYNCFHLHFDNENDETLFCIAWM